MKTYKFYRYKFFIINQYALTGQTVQVAAVQRIQLCTYRSNAVNVHIVIVRMRKNVISLTDCGIVVGARQVGLSSSDTNEKNISCSLV